MERIRSNNDPMVDIHADDAVTKNEKRSSAAVRALLGFLGFVAALWLLVSLLGSFMHHPVASANTDALDSTPAVTTKDVKTTTTTIDTVPAPVNNTSSTTTMTPMAATPEVSNPTPPPAPEATSATAPAAAATN